MNSALSSLQADLPPATVGFFKRRDRAFEQVDMDRARNQIMNRTVAEVLLAGMRPLTWYRTRDIAEDCGVPLSSARAALSELTRGG